MKRAIVTQTVPKVVPATKKMALSKTSKTTIYAWTLLLPSLLFLCLFTFYPILKTLYSSFFQQNLAMSEPLFVGLENYQMLLQDGTFIKVMKNTLWFVLGTVPTSIVLALLMAMFVNQRLKGTSIMRTLFFYPTVVPMIAIANFWLFIYTPDYGLLSKFITALGFEDVNWLGNPETVLPALMVMVIWKEAGFFMIFYLAGLQNIPKHLYEAAQIDGASTWNMFRKITLPFLMPTTLFVSILSVTNSFKSVDHLVIMTQGGPNNASSLLLYYIYETAFEFWDKGVAATLTIVLLVILVVIASVQFFGIDKKIHYS